MAQITLNSSGVASNGSLLLQSNGTTTAVTIDTAQNVGVGVTPSAWNTGVKAIEGTSDFKVMGGLTFDSLSNAYLNTSNAWIYRATGSATFVRQTSGEFRFFNAASGTAGNAISWTQAMTLDASGNLLLGTTTSNSFKFKVSDAGGAEFAFLPNDGGVNNFTNYNRSTSAYVPLSLNASDVRFSTSGTERARITSGGSLLVAKTTTNDGDTGFMFEPIRDGAGNGRLTITQSATTNSGVSFSAYSSGAAAYRFYVGMGGTIFATSTTISAISDIRYKENVRDLNVGLAEVMALKPRLYDWKEGKGQDIKNARGFIAQEFEEVFPDLIDEWKDPAPEGEDPYKSVRADLIPVLVKAIQELKAIVDAQAVEIAALKGTA